MKKIFLSALIILTSTPLWAAKVNEPVCKDLVEIETKFIPEYLAVIDGNTHAGKANRDEVDFTGIVSESKKIKEQCAKDLTLKLAGVRQDVKKQAVTEPSSSQAARVNPLRAKCADFVALGEEYQPLAAFWVAGYSKVGQVQRGEIDEEFLERPLAALIRDCKKAPTASFYERAKMWSRGHI